METKICAYLHFEYSISLPYAGQIGGAVLEHGADMLQGSVELAIDASQWSSLRHLATDIEPEARLRLVYAHRVWTRMSLCH